jgi:hypothetical protein
MPGPFYAQILEDLSNELSRCRAAEAEAMRDVDPKKLNRARAARTRVEARLGAISSGKAYGAGCDFDARGFRNLDELEQDKGVPLYQGPHDGPNDPTERGSPYQRAEDHYEVASDSNRLEPAWGGDDGLPAHDYNERRR